MCDPVTCEIDVREFFERVVVVGPQKHARNAPEHHLRLALRSALGSEAGVRPPDDKHAVESFVRGLQWTLRYFVDGRGHDERFVCAQTRTITLPAILEWLKKGGEAPHLEAHKERSPLSIG